MTLDFDALGIWPIAMKLQGAVGYGLWGDDGAGTDVLLDAGGRIQLFGSWTALAAALPTLDARLAKNAGWARLVAGLSGSIEPAKSYDLDLLEATVRAGADPSYVACGVLVDALNIVWDGLETIGRRDLKAYMRGEAPLRAIADALTFIEPLDRAATVARLPWAEAEADLGPLMTALREAIDVR